MSTTTIGIKEALIEYLQDHVLGKELTKRQVGQIEKLFVEDKPVDKVSDAVEFKDWCDKNSFEIETAHERTFKTKEFYELFKSLQLNK